MRIGITAGLGAAGERTVDGLAARAARIEEAGFAGMWMPTAFGLDAITALAVAGRATERIEIGTAVVPTFPRHPVVMAQQALTAQDALSGRFVLGIGLSHKVMMEDALGLPYGRPAHHMREYLAVLAPLLRGEPASFQGEFYRVETGVTVRTAPVPLVVAAMGPAMLRLAGTWADGTITSWVGPRTLAAHIAPTIAAAAAEAGRPAPRVIAGLPVALTGDPDGVRERLAGLTTFYTTLPAYQAMFEREGVAGPAGVALVGDERALRDGLARLAEAGATDFVAQFVVPDTEMAERTLHFLADYQRP